MKNFKLHFWLRVWRFSKRHAVACSRDLWPAEYHWDMLLKKTLDEHLTEVADALIPVKRA